ncbi:hypothetical protein LguiA_014535 [Lonicera macranthoides]
MRAIFEASMTSVLRLRSRRRRVMKDERLAGGPHVITSLFLLPLACDVGAGSGWKVVGNGCRLWG